MRKFLALLALFGMLAAGCARSQSFRVVDAQTGAPVPGVIVEQSGSALRPGTARRTEPTGIAEFNGASGRFTFRKEGYFETQAEVGSSSAKVISGEDRRQQTVERHAGLVQVPLVRNPADPGLQTGMNPGLPPRR